jgi:hypothetical protein
VTKYSPLGGAGVSPTHLLSEPPRPSLDHPSHLDTTNFGNRCLLPLAYLVMLGGKGESN